MVGGWGNVWDRGRAMIPIWVRELVIHTESTCFNWLKGHERVLDAVMEHGTWYLTGFKWNFDGSKKAEKPEKDK